MAPTSKSSRSSETGPASSGRKSPHRHHSYSKSQQSSVDSPSSKPRHKTSRTSGNGGDKENRSYHHHHRRRRSTPTAKSSLQETLSSFGDDVIRVKNWPGIAGYDNHGYFQPDVALSIPTLDEVKGKENERGTEAGTAAPFGDLPEIPMETGGVENELAMIMSQHDPNFQTKHFEKINPNEVGVKASKWQKIFQGTVSSNRFQKLKKQAKRDDLNEKIESDRFLEQFYNDKGEINFDPPFWGVSSPTRRKISFLSLSLILHELACFTSCVLLGCMIFQGMEAISWAQQKPFTDNWIFFKWYSSFQTILVVISCLGFLNRVDTTEQRSLWLLPLFLIPVLGLSVSDYCNKTWELQRLECQNYNRLDEASRQHLHVSQGQDCPSPNSIMSADVISKVGNTASETELGVRGIAPLVMRILATACALVISAYLFCCRKNHYLIDNFGPPKEFIGNIDLVLDFQRKQWNRLQVSEGNEEDDDEEDGMDIIYQRNAKRDNLIR